MVEVLNQRVRLYTNINPPGGVPAFTPSQIGEAERKEVIAQRKADKEAEKVELTQ